MRLSASPLRAGYYALLPQYISMLITTGFAGTINAWVFATPIYFLVGLRLSVGGFVVFLAILSVLSNIAVAFGLLVGAIANNFVQARPCSGQCVRCAWNGRFLTCVPGQRARVDWPTLFNFS